MSLHVSSFQFTLDCFPRVSGDEPRLVQGKGSYLTFSPRERG